MKVFSDTITEGIDSIATSGAWLILLDIVIGTDTFYLTNNTEDIVYDSRTYTRFPFKMEAVKESLKGNIPSAVLSLPNTNRTFEPYLQANNGAIGSDITLRVVYALNGIVYDTWIEEVFTVTESKADAEWVYLTLGLDSAVTKRFPRDRYISTVCRFKFKGNFCRYTGADTTCDHALTDCIAKGNSVRYGGHPGVSEGIY